MPSRISMSSRTFTPLKGTPRWERICTTRAEKPHCGKTGVPFMNSTMGLDFTSLSMRSKAGLVIGFGPSRRGGGLEGEGVQLPAHAPLQGGVDDLVLLHPALAAEGLGHDGSGVVVTVAGQVFDGDLGVGQGRFDEGLDLRRLHRH